MTDEQIALARRAIACPKWRWMPGMKVSEGFRVTESLAPFMFPVDLPDLTDPATLGCLLALVREAWRCPTVYVRQSTTRRLSDGMIAWEVCDLWLDAEACRALGVDRQGSVGSWGHASEAEALVAALEASPTA
jgi:hypothetical protein